MKTINPKKENLKEKWILINAKNQVLGRLSSKISQLLRGKDTTKFAPYLPGEKWIIVINSKEIAVTGRKKYNKLYWHHTGYPGGIKSISYEKILKKKPDFPLKKAVKGMLPKNKLNRQLLSRLKIYPGEDHPHKSQNPEIYNII